jgi:dihydrofolate reductase
VIVSLIVAVSENGVIGRDGRLPWKLPADMARFKAVTMGHPIIMGRKTYESIGRPLPGRRNIVVSSRPDFSPPGIEVVPSWETALERVRGEPEVFVIGGAVLFRNAFPDASRLYLTLVKGEVQGDTFFELPNPSHWRLVSEEFRPADPEHAFALSFRTYERV